MKLTIPSSMIEVKNLVAGQWKAARGPEFIIRSPYSGTPIGQARASTSADLDEMVQAALKAWPAWKETPLKERCQVMFRFREVLLRDLEVLAQSVALESGKTLAEARAGLLKGIEVLEFALSLQNRDEGGKMEVSRGVACEYRREPLGLVAGITPFNFPAMVPMWMIPIALTLGNAFLWKPSDKTPLTSLLLAQALKEAGLPAGVFSVAQGGREVVEQILDHPEVKAVGFVGSTPVARAVYTRGSATGKRVLALGGAKNPIILMPDADPELAAQGITDSYTGCAGQRCMAASLLLAVGETQKIIDRVIERSRQIILGEQMGAIISQEALARLHQAIAAAEKQGAKILLDGRRAKAPNVYSGGYWLGPTLLDEVSPESPAGCAELFGPVLSIVRVKTLSEALAIENSSPYGNAASVFTSSGPIADRVAREAHAGMVGVNIGVPVPREPFSFGGFQQSKFGHGDITGPTSLDFWSSLKKITTKWVAQNDQNWMS